MLIRAGGALLCSLLLLMILPELHEVRAQYGCPPISGGYEPAVIAKRSGDVFVFWNYFYGCGQRVLLFNKSLDNGDNFGDPITIADSSMAGSAPAVSVLPDSNNLYVAWLSYTQTSPALFFRKSVDNGVTFGDAIRIDTNSSVQSSVFTILVSPTNSDNIGIIWNGIASNGRTEVFLSKSQDGGKSFGPPTLISNNTSDYSVIPHIVQVGNTTYILWSSGGDAYEKDFVTRIGIDDVDREFSIKPAVSLGIIGARAIAASGNNVYVAGAITNNNNAEYNPEGIAGNVSILLAKSSDGGHTFDKPVVLAEYDSADSNHINSLMVDASENFVYVGWYNFHNHKIGAEIDARASPDYGNTFGSRQKISGGTGVFEPVVTTTLRDKYYISWQNSNSTDDASYQKLFFASSSDGGNTFSQPIDLTGGMGASNPGQAMAVDDKNGVYIAWVDYAFQDGNHIMFTKNIAGTSNFSKAIDLDKDSRALIETTPEFGPIILLLAAAGILGAIIAARRFVHRGSLFG